MSRLKSGRVMIGWAMVPAAAAAIVGLTGCGGGGSDSDSTQSSPPAHDMSAAAPLQGDQLYLAGLEQLNVRFPSDEAAVGAGKQVCTNLTAGDGLVDAIGKVGNGLDETDSGKVVGLATQTYCPDQIGKLSGVTPSN